MNVNVKYAASLEHVKEVSLKGRANLAFWKDRLAKENLVPTEQNANAQILIVAAEGKYMGLRFCEVSFSVSARRQQDGVTYDGSFLAYAFNSSRFFAFCERVFFSAPY